MVHPPEKSLSFHAGTEVSFQVPAFRERVVFVMQRKMGSGRHRSSAFRTLGKYASVIPAVNLMSSGEQRARQKAGDCVVARKLALACCVRVACESPAANVSYFKRYSDANQTFAGCATATAVQILHRSLEITNSSWRVLLSHRNPTQTLYNSA